MDIVERGAPEGERSHAFFDVMKHLKECGYTVREVYDLLGHYPNGIANKYWERLLVEIERIYSKIHRSEEGNGTDGPRPQHPVPARDAERLPIMRLLDNVLGSVDCPEPPMRNLEGKPIYIDVREPGGFHALMAMSANSENGDDAELPAPDPIPMFTIHSDVTLGFEIEEHVEFVRKVYEENKPPIIIPKALHADFVRAYMKYFKSMLPKVGQLATLPLVMPNGQILSENGLDRKTRTIFRIPANVLEFIPNDVPSDDDARAALDFLINDWLHDVACTDQEKLGLIAIALSVIERALFSERPGYLINGTKRAAGKTTVVQMVSAATTGARVPAVSWSNDPNERRKSIFSALREAPPLIAWDNIPVGSVVADATLDKALTSPQTQDRELQQSRSPIVSSTTIQVFTGNQISAGGDTSSRTLQIRISPEMPHPEARAFKHPEPIEWTLANRGRILSALYTLLLANPCFKRGGNKQQAPPAMSRLMLKSAKRASLIENLRSLRGLGKMRVR